MVEVNEDPLAWLDVVHPQYEEMDTLERVQRWRAVLDEMDSVEQKKKFLPKTEVELEADFQFRLRIAEFLGVTDSAIDRVKAAVFGIPAKIDVKDEDLTAFIEDCDGTKQSLVRFFENQVSAEAQCMGMAFVEVSRASSAGDFANKDQERKAGARRCFVTAHHREDVTNWSVDEDGSIRYVIISRRIYDQPTMQSEGQWFDERRVIEKTTITVYRRKVAKDGARKEEDRYFVYQEARPHGFSRVPIVTVYGDRRGSFNGWCVFPGAVRADIARLNEESWGALDRYRHANQLLVLKSSRDIKEMVLGHIVRLNPSEGEDLEYVSPGGTAFTAREDAIKRLRQEGISQTGTNPAATSDGANSTSGESGIAQRVRFTHTEKRSIEQHATSVEEGIRGVLTLVMDTLQVTEEIGVSFFTTFEQFEVGETMSNYQRAQFWIDADEWHAEMLKQVVSKTLPDLDEAKRQSIYEQIEAQSKKPRVDPSVDPRTHNLGN